MGYELDKTPRLKAWCDYAPRTAKGARLMQREVWQKTQPNAEQIEIFKQRVTYLVQNT